MAAIFLFSETRTHQFNFCVSFAISSSFPSFSAPWLASCTYGFNVRQTPCSEESNDEHLPRSAMLKTPDALELVLRWPIFFSAVGEDDKPEMAESTLLRSEVVSMASDDIMS